MRKLEGQRSTVNFESWRKDLSCARSGFVRVVVSPLALSPVNECRRGCPFARSDIPRTEGNGPFRRRNPPEKTANRFVSFHHTSRLHGEKEGARPPTSSRTRTKDLPSVLPDPRGHSYLSISPDQSLQIASPSPPPQTESGERRGHSVWPVLWWLSSPHRTDTGLPRPFRPLQVSHDL